MLQYASYMLQYTVHTYLFVIVNRDHARRPSQRASSETRKRKSWQRPRREGRYAHKK